MAARDRILVTGAAGYIGSHVVRHLYDEGCEVIALDRSNKWWADKWPVLPHKISIIDGDVDDYIPTWITGVVHCAGLISVEESFREPRNYFHENSVKTLDLLAHLSTKQPKPPKFVFLSSAAIYGDISGTLHEAVPARPMSPYGTSKRIVELALPWYQMHGLDSVALRLFNVAGAHPDGSLRENHDPETHLIPNAVDVAREKKLCLEVFGNDYNTPDGTTERDFVHVMDVARACLFALDALDVRGAMAPINIGSGEGSTVLEVVDEVIKNVRHPVPIVMKPRRQGDVERLVAEVGRAADWLGWKPGRSKLSTIIDDTVRSRT